MRVERRRQRKGQPGSMPVGPLADEPEEAPELVLRRGEESGKVAVAELDHR